jgi:hypothetical protein
MSERGAPHPGGAEPADKDEDVSPWLVRRLQIDPALARMALRTGRALVGRHAAGEAASPSANHAKVIPLRPAGRPMEPDPASPMNWEERLRQVADRERLFIGPRRDEGSPSPAQGHHSVPDGLINASRTLLASWDWELEGADVVIYRDLIVPARAGIDAWYLTNSSLRIDALIVAAAVLDLLREQAVQKLRSRIRSRPR